MKHLCLRGNLLSDHVGRLLDTVNFTLNSLDVEGCGLTMADFEFLARYVSLSLFFLSL